LVPLYKRHERKTFHEKITTCELWWHGLSKDTKAALACKLVRRFTEDSDKWTFLVAGGPASLVFFFLGNTAHGGWITKKIELPTNWDKILEEAVIEPIRMP
jgi:hypothetical protein